MDELRDASGLDESAGQRRAVGPGTTLGRITTRAMAEARFDREADRTGPFMGRRALRRSGASQ